MASAEQQRRIDGAGQHPVKLSCRHVWKLFGPEADTYLKDGAAPDAEALAAAGLVGAAALVLADLIGRLVGGAGEVQAGVILGLVGAPLFVLVVRRRAVTL